ncbi:hypothetical protein TSUD_266700 [Trifolium subterraneum]|uniref:Putative plant transposon protein domain-containing protein n=1 Tax=Trifolium subterraneum TaxID=3900 RepID=A0A2Z6M3W0_TRISU|nr:hypothetical protein TSUD_266700 [Trifolium subterraneum]
MSGSKKQKTGVSSSVPAQVPANVQDRFSGPAQYERFQELQARNIWPEKEFSIIADGKHGNFVEAIETLGWGKLMDPERDSEDDLCNYAANLARGNWDAPGITELLLLPGCNLIYGKSGLPVRAKGEDLTPLARLALLFVLHNVIPRSHVSDATMPILGLIYCFYKGYQVDIAKIISKELKDAVLSGTEKKIRPNMVPFTALIMGLIRKARVMFSATFRDPLGKIDDPHVERPSFGDGVGTSAGANVDGDDDPIDEEAANAFVDDDSDEENTMED